MEEVVREFHEILSRDPEGAVAVAAITALTAVVKRSSATTMMGVQKELKDAAACLQRCIISAVQKATARAFSAWPPCADDLADAVLAEVKLGMM